jgi:hypothetical protein
LQNQWNKVCSLERMWLISTGSNSQKRTFKESYCSERKSFDRRNRKYKRKYLIKFVVHSILHQYTTIVICRLDVVFNVYCVFIAANGFVNFIPYRIIDKKIVRNIIDPVFSRICHEWTTNFQGLSITYISTTVVNPDISPIGMTFCKTSGTKYVHTFIVYY